MKLAHVSSSFKLFASRECKVSSKLYEYLSEQIAEDEELLQLATNAKQGQPLPNLLFGAVHYLLLKGKNHKVSEYYGTIVNNPRPAEAAFSSFKDFCLQYKREIITILSTKLVQTNEVRRCAYLYPAFCYIYEKTKKPLALIEIGTSAGLQLLWDQYCYSYTSVEGQYGDVCSELVIESEIQGNRQPLMLKQSPPVTTRIGIDLHINNVSTADDYLWLKALIWPEHTERIANFEKAAYYVQKQSLTLIEGNGVKLLNKIALQAPLDSVLCVFHTHVANQFTLAEKLELIECLKKLGEDREVFHLYNNMWDLGKIHLDTYWAGKEYKETLAEADGHGRWFSWNL